jgi:hypothetical protein
LDSSDFSDQPVHFEKPPTFVPPSITDLLSVRFFIATAAYAWLINGAANELDSPLLQRFFQRFKSADVSCWNTFHKLDPSDRRYPYASSFGQLLSIPTQ